MTEQPAVSKKFVRIDNKIYHDGGPGVGLWLEEDFPSISEAKRWVRRQEAKVPGSVRVEQAPQKPPARVRIDEIAALSRAQDADRAQQPKADPRQAQPYVQGDNNSSSFLRQRQGKRNVSRAKRNGRSGIGRT